MVSFFRSLSIRSLTNISSQNIPPSRTLQEYEMREFMADDGRGFSSLAELIGLARAIELALGSRCTSDSDTRDLVTTSVDAATTAWSSLLPPSKKRLQRADGSIDEILFKANALLLAYVILIFLLTFSHHFPV